jgi:thymidine phosphorylase
VDIDALKIGLCCLRLGAGRERVDSSIDHSVGLLFMAKCGAKVKEGDTVVRIHYNGETKLKEVLPLIDESIRIEANKPELPQSMIVEEVNS